MIKKLKNRRAKKLMAFALSFSLAFTMLLQPSFAEEETAPEDGVGCVEGEVLVIFDDEVTEEQAEEVTGEEAELLAEEDGESQFAIVSIDEDVSCEAAAEEINEINGVVYAQPNYVYTTDSKKKKVRTSKVTKTKDKYGNKQWASDYLDVPEAWGYINKVIPKSSRTGKKRVRVVSLDTGLNIYHEDLQANVNKNLCVDITKPTETGYARLTSDKSNHGTKVAGTIAATANNKLGVAGIASGTYNDIVEFVAVCVFRDQVKVPGRPVSQGLATTADIVAGIEYAKANKADVICMCLGHNASTLDVNGEPHDDIVLEAAVEDAVASGITVVSSAGNNGNTNDWYPSDFSSTISVMATGYYANAYGICKLASSNYGPAKDVSAPGNIYTVDPIGKSRYAGFGNTSAATAATVGVVAMMKYVNPDLTPQQVKEILMSTAVDLYTEGPDAYTGAGLVNAYAAVAKAKGQTIRFNPKRAGPKKFKARSKGKGKIKLSWKKIPRTNTYEVYRRAGTTGSFELVAKPTGKSFTDTNLTPGVTYYYSIRSIGTTNDGKKVIGSWKSAKAKAK